jgi:hypothetical protein
MAKAENFIELHNGGYTKQALKLIENESIVYIFDVCIKTSSC